MGKRVFLLLTFAVTVAGWIAAFNEAWLPSAALYSFSAGMFWAREMYRSMTAPLPWNEKVK